MRRILQSNFGQALLMVGCVVGLISASQYQWSSPRIIRASFPLAAIGLAPGRLGAEDTLLFTVTFIPHTRTEIVRLPRSRCMLSFHTLPGTFGFKSAGQETLFFYRPLNRQIVIPVPYPNRYPFPSQAWPIPKPRAVTARGPGPETPNPIEG